MIHLQRVVVTGLGVVSPLGVGVGKNWADLLAGAVGLSGLDGKQYEKLPCRVAARVPEDELLAVDKTSPAERRQMSRAIRLALIAAEEAVGNSKLELASEEEREATGVAVGMGISDLEDIHATGALLDDDRYSRISPYFVPRILTNMAAGHLSIQYGLRGPNHSVATACTTGLHSIGDAFNFIRLGNAQAMLCGGTEACINPISVAGFARCRALSTGFNERPSVASRPFDKDRDGFVIGEGAGILVLESLSRAKARGARILAEILGYGLSGDGHHITSPDASGRGAELCMRRTIRDAGLESGDIGYVNAHATSTPIGDGIECDAILRVLETRTPAVSSTKGAVGHLLGAAGAVEAIYTILACVTGRIPPTANLQSPDVGAGLDLVSQKPKEWSEPGRIALTNSFGFGGTNACLCVRGWTDE